MVFFSDFLSLFDATPPSTTSEIMIDIVNAVEFHLAS